MSTSRIDRLGEFNINHRGSDYWEERVQEENNYTDYVAESNHLKTELLILTQAIEANEVTFVKDFLSRDIIIPKQISPYASSLMYSATSEMQEYLFAYCIEHKLAGTERFFAYLIHHHADDSNYVERLVETNRIYSAQTLKHMIDTDEVDIVRCLLNSDTINPDEISPYTSLLIYRATSDEMKECLLAYCIEHKLAGTKKFLLHCLYDAISRDEINCAENLLTIYDKGSESTIHYKQKVHASKTSLNCDTAQKEITAIPSEKKSSNNDLSKPVNQHSNSKYIAEFGKATTQSPKDMLDTIEILGQDSSTTDTFSCESLD